MTNEHGKQVHEAGPATPVEILGLSDVPDAGDPLHVVKDPKKAAGNRREPQGQARQEPARRRRARKSRSTSLIERLQAGEPAGAPRHRQGRRAGLGRGARRRVQQALDRQGEGQHHPRAASARSPKATCNLAIAVQGDHHRLQRPPRRQGARARRGEQGRGSPLLDHLRRRRRREERHGRPPRPTTKREAARQGRGPPDLQDPQVGVVAGCYVIDGKIIRGAKAASCATAR